MSGTLTFKASEVRRLMEHSKAAKQHRPSYKDLYNPEYHLGGKILTKNGWPDSDNIDHSKIPAGLLLVKDQGVYILSNGLPPLLVEGETRNVVAYAKEADPTDGSDDWWDAGREIMGGDDCVETLSLTMFEPVLEVLENDGELKIKITETEISIPVVSKKKGGKS